MSIDGRILTIGVSLHDFVFSSFFLFFFYSKCKSFSYNHLRKQSYKTIKTKTKVNKNKWLSKINFYKEIQLQIIPRANPVSSEWVQAFFSKKPKRVRKLKYNRNNKNQIKKHREFHNDKEQPQKSSTLNPYQLNQTLASRSTIIQKWK